MSDLTNKIALLRSLVHDGQERRLCDEIEGAVRILEDHPIARMQVGLQGVPGNTVEALEMWHCEARQLAHELRVLRITPGEDQPMMTRKEKPELETGNTGERARRRAWTAACSTGTSEPTMHERAERISRARGWGLAEPLSDDCWPVMFVPDRGRVEPVCLPPAILAALAPDRPPSLECAARKQGTPGGMDAVDCDWPYCGCDSHANKVIAALQEQGWTGPRDSDRLKEVRSVVDAQAEDEGLWFVAATAPEAYLQQELRRLHDAVEKALGQGNVDA